jgi:hypothetical protein
MRCVPHGCRRAVDIIELEAVLAAGLIACAPVKAQPADGLLGATVDGLLAAGRWLSPALRAAALDTAAATAKARRSNHQRQLPILEGSQRLQRAHAHAVPVLSVVGQA